MARRNRSYRTVQRYRKTSRGVALAVGGVFVVVLVVSFFFDEMGVPKYLAMRQHARQLEQEIQELEQENAELRKDIHRLQHDSARIEELARERLGFVRKGETVYQLLEKEARSE